MAIKFLMPPRVIQKLNHETRANHVAVLSRYQHAYCFFCVTASIMSTLINALLTALSGQARELDMLMKPWCSVELDTHSRSTALNFIWGNVTNL